MNSQAHLTEEQFCELVERSAQAGNRTAAKDHLDTCEQCRTELNSMREDLALFRETAAAFAERELARTPRVEPTRFQPVHHVFSPGFAWAAAGLLVVATALPFSLRHKVAPVPVAHRAVTVATPTQLSDEALLEDINREVSASVPASMQALEDPTGSASARSTDAQTSSTRKN